MVGKSEKVVEMVVDRDARSGLRNCMFVRLWVVYDRSDSFWAVVRNSLLVEVGCGMLLAALAAYRLIRECLLPFAYGLSLDLDSYLSVLFFTKIWHNPSIRVKGKDFLVL